MGISIVVFVVVVVVAAAAVGDMGSEDNRMKMCASKIPIEMNGI